MIFLVILFKMFAPGIYELVIEFATTMLVFLNESADTLASGSGALYDEFPEGL